MVVIRQPSARLAIATHTCLRRCNIATSVYVYHRMSNITPPPPNTSAHSRSRDQRKADPGFLSLLDDMLPQGSAKSRTNSRLAVDANAFRPANVSQLQKN